MTGSDIVLEIRHISKKLGGRDILTDCSPTVARGEMIVLIGLSGDDLTESIQSASESLRSAEISMQNMQEARNNYPITDTFNGTSIKKDAKEDDAAEAGFPVKVSGDYETVAGWRMDEFDCAPQLGDEFAKDGFTFKVRKVRRRRISELLVTKTEQA